MVGRLTGQLGEVNAQLDVHQDEILTVLVAHSPGFLTSMLGAGIRTAAAILSAVEGENPTMPPARQPLPAATPSSAAPEHRNIRLQ